MVYIQEVYQSLQVIVLLRTLILLDAVVGCARKVHTNNAALKSYIIILVRLIHCWLFNLMRDFILKTVKVLTTPLTQNSNFFLLCIAGFE